MPSSSHLFGSVPWGAPVPVSGQPFHHTPYSGAVPMAGGMAGGMHNQFIPLQVRPGNRIICFKRISQCSKMTDNRIVYYSIITYSLPIRSPVLVWVLRL